MKDPIPLTLFFERVAPVSSRWMSNANYKKIIQKYDGNNLCIIYTFSQGNNNRTSYYIHRLFHIVCWIIVVTFLISTSTYFKGSSIIIGIIRLNRICGRVLFSAVFWMLIASGTWSTGTQDQSLSFDWIGVRLSYSIRSSHQLFSSCSINSGSEIFVTAN